MDLNQIREHWRKAGGELLLSERVTPTSRDPFLGELEENYIVQHLESDQLVLEVGCGDAIHTLKYAQHVKFIWGVDVADTLISLANQKKESATVANVEFMVGSVLSLEEVPGQRQLDCVISQRCLINLPEWKHQQQALLGIHEVLKTGGLFLMTEGFQDELEELNSLRRKVRLSNINVVDYNRNFRHGEFDEFIENYFSIEAIHDYGHYLFLSRVYHPLVVAPDQPKHDSRHNEVASLLSALIPSSDFRQFSYNLCYVLRKK
ncbi:MAG: class I SAM-dependent methyltransferase [Pyrinomonadaceae bacterium]